MLSALDEAGIDMGDVTKKLLRDGDRRVRHAVRQADRRRGVQQGGGGHRPPAHRSTPRSPTSWSRRWRSGSRSAVEENVAERIWRKDEALWGGPGPEIGNRLGWLTICEPMLEHAGDLDGVRRRGAGRRLHRRRAARHGRLVAGTGGDPALVRRRSRAVSRCTCSTRPTPARCWSWSRAVDLAKTLFIVSSKSGGTVETLSHMKHFYERTRRQRLAVRGRDRPRLAAGGPGGRARLPARVRERPEHRRALLGAVVLRAGAGGADGRRRGGAAERVPGGRAELQQLRHHRRRTAASGWDWRWASWRCRAATSSPSSCPSRSPASACGWSS